MTDERRLERQLPAILEDLYLGPTPDYRDHVLAAVGRSRQRPSWTFPERWLPMAEIAHRPAVAPRLPWRTIGVLLVIAALLVTATVVYTGTRSRLPPPFGVARNGLIAFATGGDLYAADPATGAVRTLVTGPESDQQPVFSPDGTRVAFLRKAGDSLVLYDLMVAGADGTDQRVVAGKIHVPDLMGWSGNGSSLVVNTGDGQVIEYDATGKEAPAVLLEHARITSGALRPPDGRQVLYQPDSPLGISLWLSSADGTAPRHLIDIPAAEAHDPDLEEFRWSPDGTMVAFTRSATDDPTQTRIFVMNADGTGVRPLTDAVGAWTETDLAWSPDGTRIAFDRWRQDPTTGSWEIQPLGVAPVAGGPVTSLGPTPVSDGAWFSWSPDGRSILSIPGSVTGPAPTMTQARPLLIDVPSGTTRELAWSLSSAPSWQRLAP